MFMRSSSVMPLRMRITMSSALGLLVPLFRLFILVRMSLLEDRPFAREVDNIVAVFRR